MERVVTSPPLFPHPGPAAGAAFFSGRGPAPIVSIIQGRRVCGKHRDSCSSHAFHPQGPGLHCFERTKFVTDFVLRFNGTCSTLSA
jgi:hypothetical protein